MDQFNNNKKDCLVYWLIWLVFDCIDESMSAQRIMEFLFADIPYRLQSCTKMDIHPSHLHIPAKHTDSFVSWANTRNQYKEANVTHPLPVLKWPLFTGQSMKHHTSGRTLFCPYIQYFLTTNAFHVECSRGKQGKTGGKRPMGGLAQEECVESGSCT